MSWRSWAESETGEGGQWRGWTEPGTGSGGTRREDDNGQTGAMSTGGVGSGAGAAVALRRGVHCPVSSAV